jgi:ribosomal protein S18 acetylase RimI-like enzyme
MLTGLVVRPMQAGDLDFAAACTAAEEWVSEDRTVLDGFFQHDPGGCLLAELDGEPVGMCIATPYGASAFIGELIVLPQARGKGIGAALLNHAVDYLQKNGARSVYLDGVPKAVPMYQRNGFKIVCRSLRFSGSLPPGLHDEVRPMHLADLPDVLALDRRAFGANRSFFLKRRWELHPELGRVLIEKGKIAGFILGRCGEGWVSAGPWVVEEDARHTLELLESLAAEVKEDYFSVGILECNQTAIKLVRSIGFTERPDCPWRMVLGEADQLGASAQCYAVGSAAKG